MHPFLSPHSPICLKLLWHCPLLHLGGAWESWPCDDMVRTVPPDFSELYHEIAADRSEEELLDAGVAQRQADGSLAPAAGLLEAGKPLIFLSKPGTEMPDSVLTTAGCLRPGQLPLLASLDDAVTQQAIDFHKRLLVVPFVEDVIVCRALGLPATLAAGLDRVDPSLFQTLCDRCHWVPFPVLPDDPLDAVDDLDDFDKQVDPTVLLVNWSPATLSRAEPPGMDAVVAHLRAMMKSFRIDSMDVGLWDPDQAFVDGFAARLKFGRPEIDPKTLLAEVEGSFVDPLNDPLRSPPPRQLPSSFAMAAELHRRAQAAARSGLATTEVLQRTRADYDEVLNQMVSRLVQPSASPEAQNRQAAQMVISRTLHQIAPSLDHTLACLGPVLNSEHFPHREINAVVKLAATLSKLGKESDACPGKRVNTPPSPRGRRKSVGSPTWTSRSRITGS